MSINYQKYQDDLHFTYNNVIDALEDFEKKTNNENKAEVLFRISDLQKTLSSMKHRIKNIAIIQKKW